METLAVLKKELTREQQGGGKASVIMHVLDRMEQVTVDATMLAKTEAGIAVNRLRKHDDPAVGARARAVIKKWKLDMASRQNGSSSTKTERKSTSTSSSASPTPDSTRVPATGDSSAVQNTPKAPTPGTDAQELLSVSTDLKSKSLPGSAPLSAATSTTTVAEMDGIRVITDTNRNAKIDQVTLQSTNDAVRDKSVDIIYTALASNTDADSVIVKSKAVGIEEHVYTHLSNGRSSSPVYREKIRSLFLNLRDQSNPTLRLRVLCGSLPVKAFCTMTAEEMKSTERLSEEKKLREENIFNARGATPQEAETDMFKCGKCRQRKCRYYQMQTRSADEPMTTFVTCVNCNNRWKFC